MTSEDRLAAHLANLKASLDEPKHKPIGYDVTDRGIILLFATEEEARAAYEDAQSKEHKCELHEDRLIMLEFGSTATKLKNCVSLELMRTRYLA